MRTTYIDVVCRDRKDEVSDELKRILHVEDLDPADPQVFQQRTRAAKQVFEQMNEQEKEEIRKLVAKYKEEGNDEKTRIQ
jgi:NAD(P)H-dependent FMN reductase